MNRSFKRTRENLKRKKILLNLDIEREQKNAINCLYKFIPHYPITLTDEKVMIPPKTFGLLAFHCALSFHGFNNRVAGTQSGFLVWGAPGYIGCNMYLCILFIYNINIPIPNMFLASFITFV